MKLLQIKKYFLCGIALLGVSFQACDDSIELGQADESILNQADATYLSLHNSNDSRPLRVINVFAEKKGEAKVHVELNKPGTHLLHAQITSDPALVEIYNQRNGTDFEMYPIDCVKIENEGETFIVPGDRKSLPLSLNFTAYGEQGKSYLFPVTVKVSDDGVKIHQESYTFIVTNKGNIPDTRKESGIITNFFIETRDTNPLNAGEWILKYSKKPLADIVCLFAANINYNNASGRVEVRMNEHITPLLTNRDHYIKPLQDKGIKVTLSILGNWDAAGLANLAPETAKDFARELKAIVDAYGLDGIELDDEYSAYEQAEGIPGFVVPPTGDAFARLCYEIKRIMPDKLCNVYHIGMPEWGLYNPVEEMNPGDFIDYVYEAYYGSFNARIQNNYLGMQKKQVAPYSRKILKGLTFNESDMSRLRNGYGVNMLYNYQADLTETYKPQFNKMCEILYDEGVEHTGIVHEKDFGI